MEVAHQHDVATASPELRLEGVCRAFGERDVIRDLAWTHEGPGVVGVVGPNGSGKTTLVRLIGQLLEPDEGSIHVCGIGTTGPRAHDARRLVGYAPHRPIARTMRTVRANLEHAARLRGMRRMDACEQAALSMHTWSLTDLATVSAGRLSRGQAQRYVLAMADMGSPPVILLDEPTVGLDDAGRGQLDAAIDRWKADRLILVASHERAWLAGHCTAYIDLVGAPS
jgi:ABC-2 type transport system ATP-binding protein